MRSEPGLDEHTAFLEGIARFNAGEFFEAHEVLEDVWMLEVGPDKRFLQGLIQLAVAFHHAGNENMVGTEGLLTKGIEKLEAYPPRHYGVHLTELVAAARRCLEDARDVRGGRKLAFDLGLIPQIALDPDAGPPR
jgi:predicted metal-dependent hydrolase